MGCGSSNNANETNDPKAKREKINYNNFILSHKNRSYKQDYQLGKMLGEGGFGQVYICKHKQSGDIRVLKKMAKDGLTDEELKQNMVQDVAILQQLSHPSVIKTYEFYQDDYMFYIVSEYCSGGALVDRVVQQEMFSEKEAASVLKQVLEAINYTHQQEIFHRDLKLENIVLDEQTKSERLIYPIKVIDYGCSGYFTKGKLYDELCGTPLYMSPELLKNKYNEKTDIWSIGVILYLLLIGLPPFNGNSLEELFDNIKNKPVNFDEPAFKSLSDDVKDILSKLLEKDYTKRPSAYQALQHSWFQNAQQEQLSDEGKEQALKNLKHFQIQSNLQGAIIQFITTQFVTKAEQKNMQIAFKEMDKDGSGTIGKDEILNYFKQFMIDDSIEDEVNGLFSKLDENNSGVINYNEFIQASLGLQKVVSDKNLKAAFDYFDQDSNGQITSQELKNILGSHHKKDIGIEQIIQQLNDFDKDGDKQINYEEFKEMMLNYKKKHNATLQQS